MDCRSIWWIGVLLVFLQIIFLPNKTAGQAYHFDRFTVNEGLPNMLVWDIHQDTDGYLWIATAGGGLSRFDGTTFVNYDSDDGFHNEFVHTIFEDDQQRLWLGSYHSGVARIVDGQPEYQFTDTPLDDEFIPMIRQDDEGRIWFATYESGVFVYDDDLTQISEEDGLLSDTVWDIYFRDDQIWLATHQGLSVYEDGEFINYTTDDGLSGDKVFRIEEGWHQSIWLATDSGVTIFDEGDDIRTISEINDDRLRYIFDIRFSSDEEMWIGTETSGIYVLEAPYDTDAKHITNRTGLSSNYIYRLYEDKNRNMWVGTAEKGLNLFRGERFRFLNNQSGLPTNEVLAIYQDRQEDIWLGTGNGLYHYDDEEFTGFDIPVENPLDERVWSIDEINEGEYLLLLENSDLWLLDDGEFTNFSDRHDLGDLFIYDFNYDETDEILWIASENGLIRIKNEQLTIFNEKDGLRAPHIYHIHQDLYSDDLWLSTSDGFSRFDGEKFENISYEEGLPHHEVNYITQDKRGDIWAGTPKGVTLYKTNPDEKGEMTHFSSENGMVAEETVALWYDSDRDHLWQATHAGIQQLKINEYRETGEMTIIHHRLSRVSKGIEVNYNAVTECSAGNAWFGTMEGVVKLNPAKETPGVSHSPRVHLEEIELNARPVEWQEYTDELSYRATFLKFPDVTFPYGNNTFTFTFSAVDYIFPENLTLRYKLEGLDEDWTKVQRLRYAKYSNLPSGDYTFRVQVQDYDGAWDEGVTYNFSVDVPYWQTAWFWSVIFGVLFVTGYSVIHYRRYKFETETLQKRVDERTSDLKEALDDKDTLLKETHHRVKNNLAVIYSLLEMQKQYLDNDLSVQIINDSQLRINTIAEVHENLYQQNRLSRINAEDYIKDLVTKISSSYDSGKGNISIHYDIDTLELNMKYAIPCGLILNELITNAFKYAFQRRDKGTIYIGMKERDDEIILSVADDGVGLPEQQQEGQSQTLGMSIVKSLSRQLDGDLKIDSSSEGTTFAIHIRKNTILKDTMNDFV